MANSIASAALVLGLNSAKLIGGLPAVASKINRWASSTAASVNGALARVGSGIGSGLKLGALGVGVAGLGVAVAGVAKSFDTLKDLSQIDNAAKAFGLTTEAATGLFGVMEASGSGVRESIESLVTMSGRIKDVLTGSGEESKKLFDGLSVSAQDLAGLDPAEQFYRLHEAILQLPDPVERVNRLMLVAGEDGGKTLINTLSMTTDELRAMAKGFETSASDMKQVADAQKSLNAAGAALSKVWRSLVVAIAPVFDTVARNITNMVASVGSAGSVFEKLRGRVASVWASFKETPTFAGLAEAVGPVLRVVAAVGAVVLVAKLATVGVGLLAGAIAAVGATVYFLATPVGALMALSAAAGYAFLTMTERGQQFEGWVVGSLKSAFDSVKATALQAFTGISDALKAGDIGLAFKIGTTAIQLEWTKLVNFLDESWATFKAEFVKGWEYLKLVVANVFDAIVTGVAVGMVKAKRAMRLISEDESKSQQDNLRNDLWKEVEKRNSDYNRLAQKIDADLVASANKAAQDKINALQREMDKLTESARLKKELFEAERKLKEQGITDLKPRKPLQDMTAEELKKFKEGLAKKQVQPPPEEEKKKPKGEIKSAGAAVVGSKEDFEIRGRTFTAQFNKDKAQLNEAKKTNAILGNIEKKMLSDNSKLVLKTI